MGSPKMSFSLNEMVDRYWTPSQAPVQPLLLGGVFHHAAKPPASRRRVL